MQSNHNDKFELLISKNKKVMLGLLIEQLIILLELIIESRGNVMNNAI